MERSYDRGREGAKLNSAHVPPELTEARRVSVTYTG